MRSTASCVLSCVLLCAWLPACASAGAPLPEGADRAPPAPQQGARVAGDGFTRVDTLFDSEGLRCAAWLYLPEGGERPPVVVFAHGLSGQREMALPRFAEHFARAGMASLLFDYRYWGDSEGEPRHWVDAWKQLADLEAAVLTGPPALEARETMLSEGNGCRLPFSVFRFPSSVFRFPGSCSAASRMPLR